MSSGLKARELKRFQERGEGSKSREEVHRGIRIAAQLFFSFYRTGCIEVDDTEL